MTIQIDPMSEAYVNLIVPTGNAGPAMSDWVCTQEGCSKSAILGRMYDGYGWCARHSVTCMVSSQIVGVFPTAVNHTPKPVRHGARWFHCTDCKRWFETLDERLYHCPECEGCRLAERLDHPEPKDLSSHSSAAPVAVSHGDVYRSKDGREWTSLYKLTGEEGGCLEWVPSN